MAQTAGLCIPRYRFYRFHLIVSTWPPAAHRSVAPRHLPAARDAISHAQAGSCVVFLGPLGIVCGRGVCVAVMTMGENPRKATLAAPFAASARPDWPAKARIRRHCAQNHPQSARGLPHRACRSPLDVQYCGEGRGRGLPGGLQWAKTDLYRPFLAQTAGLDACDAPFGGTAGGGGVRLRRMCTRAAMPASNEPSLSFDQAGTAPPAPGPCAW